MMALALKDLIPSVKASEQDAPRLRKPEFQSLGPGDPIGKNGHDGGAGAGKSASPSSPITVPVMTPLAASADPQPIVFGGLDKLIPVKAQKIVTIVPEETQIVRTEAWARGLRDAEILWQEQLSQQRQKLHEEFESMKQLLAAELHRQLKGQIAGQLEKIRNDLADQVAETLEPFIAEHAHVRIVKMFADVAEQALQDSIADSPLLSGPDHLIRQLGNVVDCEKLTEMVGSVETTRQQTEETELSLKVDNSVFETRLSDYLTQLKQAVQDD
ncbi:hypothetical protein [Cohaesibacter haloalkalitolerans]|uniref:hypothetical protein n=1 Tax=Cohaesibacter haloalkalitolerans TaxID=1162980 RepID=UPI000E65D2A7|nr:hypothetical protein [Cohaesibacter haloalkalitolerans]